MYIKIQITKVYKITITSVGDSLDDNNHHRAIVIIQRYSAHDARPS